jgi:hypothetical protein
MVDDWSWMPDETGLDDDEFPPLDFGLEDDDDVCEYCGEEACERSCTGALLADAGEDAPP